MQWRGMFSDISPCVWPVKFY